jgi:hypothetical protein
MLFGLTFQQGDCSSPSSHWAFLTGAPFFSDSEEPRAEQQRYSDIALACATLTARRCPMKIVKAAAAAALLACGATLAFAQTQPQPQTTPSDSPSKAQPGAPDQGPGKQAPTGTGGAAIGPPAAPATPAPGTNPTGISQEKQKSEQDDPLQGGKKK